MKTKYDLIPLINTIAAVGQCRGKRYSYPTEETILKNMERFHGTVKSKRTLSRDKKQLKEAGLCEFFQRATRNPDGTKKFSSCLYTLTRKAYRFLGSVIQKLTYFKRPATKAFPKKESPGIPSWIPEPEREPPLGYEENLKRLASLIKSIA